MVPHQRDARRDLHLGADRDHSDRATEDIGAPGRLSGLDSWYDGATLTHLAGIPSIGFGPPGFDLDGATVAHTIDEFVPIDGLVKCSQALAVAAVRFCS